MTSAAAPPPGTPCVVIDCGQPATLYVQVLDSLILDDESVIAMCDDHAANWRSGDPL